MTKEQKYSFGKNKIIYEDPPWRFRNWSMESKAVQGEKWGRAHGRSPYDSMDHEDLCTLPISKLADKDCVRLTWATYPKLKEAIDYVGAERNEKGKSIWTYKTVLFCWVKLNRRYEKNIQKMWDGDQYTYQEVMEKQFFFGSGFYTHANTEILLLSTRGHGLPVLNRTVRQIILEPVSNHSAKPPIVRDKILQLFGDVQPRIELFVRGTIQDGWVGTGLEYDEMKIGEILK